MIGKDLTILHHNTMPFNRNNQSDGYLLHISKSLNHSLKSFSPGSASPLHPLSCNFPGNRFCWVCFPPGVSSESLPQLPHCNHSCALKIGSKFHLIFFFHLILWCPAAVNIPVPPIAQRDFTVTVYTPLISPVSS